MRVVFRVDASHRMGTGHVMRCLTLSDAIREQGGECCFIHRAHPGNLASLIRERGYPVYMLPEPASTIKPVSDSDYAQWLSVTQVEDATQTITILRATPPDWLVVDHYGLDAEWERNLQPHASRIFVIDDLANRPHQCDILLDQNYNTAEDRYQHLIPDKAQRLFGPRYALLRPEYLEERKRLRPRTGRVQRVLTFFGGSDSRNVTGHALRALCNPVLADLKVDVVVGGNSLHLVELKKMVANRPNTQLHQRLPHLANLMVKADLALGGGGSTSWERCCLGLPSIVIALADNQRTTCEGLSAESYIHYLGMANDVNEEKIVTAIQYALNHPNEIRKQSEQMQTLVSGDGVERVSTKFMESW